MLNIFGTSVINPTVGTIDWKIEQLKDIDSRIRKIKSIVSSFHPNSEVDRLQAPRYRGGRGFKWVQTISECRVASLWNHLEKHKDKHTALSFIYQ